MNNDKAEHPIPEYRFNEGELTKLLYEYRQRWDNEDSGYEFFREGYRLAATDFQSQPLPVGEAELRDIISRADRYLREINDGEVDDPSVGLHRDQTLIELINEIDALPAPNPSRAGEISPALNREDVAAVKEKLQGNRADYLERAEAEDISKSDDYEAGFIACIRRMNGLLNIRMKEIPPTPAPEVKEERKCDCCGTMNTPDDDGIYRECSNCMNEFEPVKDTPVEKKQYPIGGYAPGNYICYCCICKKSFMGDKRAVQCEPCAEKMVQESSGKDYAHVHINLPSGARATVSPDASPELLNALDKMAQLAKVAPDANGMCDEIKALTQQRNEAREELEQVKLSFHQASEVVKQLTAELVAK